MYLETSTVKYYQMSKILLAFKSQKLHFMKNQYIAWLIKYLKIYFWDLNTTNVIILFVVRLPIVVHVNCTTHCQDIKWDTILTYEIARLSEVGKNLGAFSRHFDNERRHLTMVMLQANNSLWLFLSEDRIAN